MWYLSTVFWTERWLKMSHQFSSWKNKLILFEKCNQSCGMKKLFQISHQYSSWTQETSDQKAMWTITWGLNISAHHVYIGLSKKELSKFTNMQFIKNKNRFHIICVESKSFVRYFICCFDLILFSSILFCQISIILL